MGKADAVPHPFILEVKPGEGRRLEARERFGFEMWLIGDADAFSPFVIYAVERMGELGFGGDAVPCRLARAEVVFPDSSSRVILKNGEAVGALEKSLYSVSEWSTGATDLEEDGLTLTFETPLRIKHEGRLVRDLPFRLLLQHLERRARLTASLHGKLPLSAPDDELIQLASDIRVEENRLRWFDWERYSSRQDATMKLGGLMGSIRYQGNPAPFQALLHAGEILHIGKGTSFGLGKYVIKR
jgi:CRISPR-associated endoribonuclease Cas6